MAGNLFISQALLVLVILNGVISMRTNPRHKAPHMCDTIDDSSEERCPKTTPHLAYHTQNPGMGPLRASEFKEKYTLFIGDDRPYPFTYDTFENSKAREKFIPGAPLKVLIHGFLNNGNSLFPTNVRDAYLERMKNNPGIYYNVIVYDWGKGACAAIGGWDSLFRPYNNAADNVEEAGKRLGDMLVKIQKLGIAKVSNDVHLIGHSLGSHVAGHAGRQVFRELKDLCWRTSALDPAGPYFWDDKMFISKQDPFSRLHRNRFRFLDVYHTSEDYGSNRKIGNVDFFINGGKHQESCEIEYTVPIVGVKIPIWVFKKILQVCSHNYATDIFAQTINGPNRTACTGCYSYREFLNKRCKCEDEIIFGEFVDQERLDGFPLTFGTAYLTTEKDTSVGSNYMQMIMKRGLFGFQFFLDGMKALCFFNFLS